MRIVLCLLILSFSGCLSEGDAEAMDSEPVPAGFDLDVSEEANEKEWQVLLDWRGGDFEWDTLCLNGGGFAPMREPGFIKDNATELFVHVTVPMTMTGYQVGHSLDGGDITWLEVVPAGQNANLTISLSGDFAEEKTHRWDFHMQANIPAAEQECYTGGGQGPPRVKVVAHNA